MATVKLVKDIYKYLDKAVIDIPENLYVPYTTIYAGQDDPTLNPLFLRDFKKVFTRWINLKKQQGIDEFLNQEDDFTSDSDELSEVYKKYISTTAHPLEFSKFVTAYTNYSKQFKL
jgi:hypothetical protein